MANEHYLDHIEKIKVYKDLLLHNLVRNGSQPTKEYVNQMITQIDLRLAVFDYERVNSASNVSVEKLNSDLYCIYKDLEILYKVVYKIQEEKYNALESIINGYLTSLEAIADEAENKAAIETSGTTLGTTIYFSDNNPVYTFDGNVAIFYLNVVSASDMSTLYFQINGTGFNKENCVLILDSNRAVLPYDVHQDTIYLNQGTEQAVNTYEYILDEKEIRTGAFMIASETLTPVSDYDYLVFGASNQFRVTGGTDPLVDKYTTSYLANHTVTISFYAINASYMNFEFSQEPLFKNFAEYQDNNVTDEIKFYRFKVAAGTSFNFETDGDVFATRENVSISDGNLYLENTTPATDFKIFEYIPGETIDFDTAEVRIYDADEDSFKVNSIAIKQLTRIQRIEGALT